MLSLFNSNFCFASFASQTPALCSVIYTVPRKSVVRLCLIFLYSVIFVFACFASQTSGLCSAFPSAPVKSVTRFCYALVRTLFCVFCLTNTGFAQCYSLGSCTVFCTLVFNFALFNNFCFTCFASQTSGLCSAVPSAPVKSVARLCLILFYSVIFVFACFASQTSGLCSAFPSAPVKSVTRFCYALVRTLFCVFCLTNTGFAQCYSLGSCTVFCTLVFNFALFNNFCFTCFASQTSGLCSAVPSAPVKSVARLCLILFYSVIFVFACFASQTSGLCSAFPSAPVKSVTRFCYALY